MREIWKDVKWYEWKYMVSNMWKVKSLDRYIKHSNKQKYFRKWCRLRWHLDKDWYDYVILYKYWFGKWYRVHRLVAQAFILNPNNKREVNHKNGIQNDNVVSNLERVTKSENERHAIDKLWKTIRNKWKLWKKNCRSKKIIQFSQMGKKIKIWDSMMDVQRKLWISYPWISDCCRWVSEFAWGYRRKYFKW